MWSVGEVLGTQYTCRMASTVSCIMVMVDHDNAEAAALKVLASLASKTDPWTLVHYK
jgi:hypothetical protein